MSDYDEDLKQSVIEMAQIQIQHQPWVTASKGVASTAWKPVSGKSLYVGNLDCNASDMQIDFVFRVFQQRCLCMFSYTYNDRMSTFTCASILPPPSNLWLGKSLDKTWKNVCGSSVLFQKIAKLVKAAKKKKVQWVVAPSLGQAKKAEKKSATLAQWSRRERKKDLKRKGKKKTKEKTGREAQVHFSAKEIKSCR